MAGSELNMKDKNEIKRLWKLGIKKRQIARATKVHRNTVSKYIEEFISENSGQKNTIKSIAPANYSAGPTDSPSLTQQTGLNKKDSCKPLHCSCGSLNTLCC